MKDQTALYLEGYRPNRIHYFVRFAYLDGVRAEKARTRRSPYSYGVRMAAARMTDANLGTDATRLGRLAANGLYARRIGSGTSGKARRCLLFEATTEAIEQVSPNFTNSYLKLREAILDMVATETERGEVR